MPNKILIFKNTSGNEFAISAKEKEFKTGSRGYFLNGKMTLDGKRYQLSGNLVEIGSGKKGK